MSSRLITIWIALAGGLSVGLVLFVYRVAGLPLWAALLSPFVCYLGYGTLNVIGTWLGHRDEERRRRTNLPNRR